METLLPTNNLSTPAIFFSLNDLIAMVLAVSKVLIAPIFSNSRNFETEGNTPEKHGIKSLDFQEIYHFNFSVFVLIRSVSKLQRLEIVRALN